MKKTRLLLLLALLMTAATGAWAQEPATTYSMKKLTVPDTWTGDMTVFSAADLPSDFAAVGDDVVTTIPAPTATGNAVLIYGFSGGETKYVEYANGVQSATDSRDFLRDHIYGYVNIMGYEGVYYTAAAGTSATYSVKMKDGVKDADKWTISPNPAEEGQTVTLQYNGRLKVKSVKAVKKAAPAYTMAAAATTSDKGKLICTAGHIHVYGEDAACTAGRVAKIIYVGPTGHATYNNGLALALEDMSTDPSTLFTWDKSGANNDGKTAAELCSAWNTSKPVTDAEWLLASKDQWNYMLGTNGAGSYTALRDGFESVGGSNLVEKDYWSSTEINDTQAWMFNFGYDWWYDYSKGTAYPQVRACLAF